MITLIIISILLVALYVGAAIWTRRELPDSISAMVYLLPKGDYMWLWSIWLIAVSLLTFPPVIGILDADGKGVLGFLPMVCLAFVAVWPLFDTDHKVWHYVLGFLAGVFSQVCVVYICPWWLLLWLVMVAMAVYAYVVTEYPAWLRGKGIFVAECICYMSVVGAMAFHLP